MAGKEIPRVRVVGREDITDDLMKLWLEPPAEFKGFQPGQYCTIGVDGIERPYSIASAPHEGLIELFLELIPNMFRTPESLTPKLWELHEGDFVTMRPKAKGTFLLDQAVETHAMIATVTGVAPFVSMLRAMRNGYYTALEPFAWFYLFQGASYWNEFGYDKELQVMMDDNRRKVNTMNNPFVIYIPTVSRPDESRNISWRKQTGRVNHIVEKYFYDFDIRPFLDTKIYLCGNQGMIDYLGNEIPSANKPLGKLIAEGYSVKQEVFF